MMLTINASHFAAHRSCRFQVCLAVPIQRRDEKVDVVVIPNAPHKHFPHKQINHNTSAA